MKIVVCVKEVLDVSFPFVLDQETLAPIRDDVFYKVNPADRSAAEMAVVLQERYSGEVVYLSFGPPRVEKSLRACLAIGGNRALRVWKDENSSGSRFRAYALAKAIERLSPDIILCGVRSLDEGTAETPGILAEFLGLPQVTGVTDLVLHAESQKVIVKRKLERGKRVEIECPMPAVLAVETDVQQPRYAELPNIIAAKRAEIDCLDADSLELDCSLIREINDLAKPAGSSLPRPRPKKSFDMESGLTAEQRMEMMMSGGLKQKSTDLWEGSPEELANKLAGLIQEKILSRS